LNDHLIAAASHDFKRPVEKNTCSLPRQNNVEAFHAGQFHVYKGEPNEGYLPIISVKKYVEKGN